MCVAVGLSESGSETPAVLVVAQPNAARHSLRHDRRRGKLSLAAVLPRQNCARRAVAMGQAAHVESIRIQPWDGQTREVEKGESLWPEREMEMEKG